MTTRIAIAAFRYCFLFVCCLTINNLLYAQTEPNKGRDGESYGTMTIKGTVVKILIIDGDTIPVIDYDAIEVAQKRTFPNPDERRRYNQWRKHAAKVYPYAAEAIKIFRQIERETAEMRKGKRKKYSRKLEQELKPKYEEELKRLTKTQGYILIKMVERELQRPFYDVIAQLRGGWEAFKWQSMGVFYGYNLQQGYDAAKDPLLESILQDLNISYEEPATEGDKKAKDKKDDTKKD